MLRLLTDEHISPAVARAVHRTTPTIDVVCLRDWEHGQMLSAKDELVLQEAHRQRRTLVTYDLRTIPPLLRAWAEEGQDHAGVILIDERTLHPADIRRLARALTKLWHAEHRHDWQNRVLFLRAE